MDLAITDDWISHHHKLYFYTGGTTRQTLYSHSLIESSQIPIIRGKVVTVQFRQGGVIILLFKIKYLAYSARPYSVVYDLVTSTVGKYVNVFNYLKPLIQAAHQWAIQLLITQMYLEHRLALLQLYLHSRLNTWLQWTGQRQVQDEPRNI